MAGSTQWLYPINGEWALFKTRFIIPFQPQFANAQGL
jgi:hypothetical protein